MSLGHTLTEPFLLMKKMLKIFMSVVYESVYRHIFCNNSLKWLIPNNGKDTI